MKKGLVLEGGGLRGIFTAGILDVLMEEGIEFDGAVGVSAGAAFGCNYKSKQQKRAISYNLKFARDHRYSSLRSLLSTGDLFGAQFCYHDIPEKLFPFDWETFRENPMEFYLVCTDVETGKPVYHLCGDEADWEMMEWFRASGSMPLVSRVVEIGDYRLLDGGVADSIPLRFMEEQGYDRNLVILTRPAGYIKKPTSMMPLVSRALRQYPEAVRAMERRHLVYNEELAYVRRREAEKFAFVIRPETDLDIGRVEHDRFKIRAAYKEGRRTARRLLPQIRSFLLAADVSEPQKAAADILAPADRSVHVSEPQKAAADILAPVDRSVHVSEPAKAAADSLAPADQAADVSPKKGTAFAGKGVEEVELPRIPGLKRRRRVWRPGELTALKRRIGWEKENSSV